MNKNNEKQMNKNNSGGYLLLKKIRYDVRFIVFGRLK